MDELEEFKKRRLKELKEKALEKGEEEINAKLELQNQVEQLELLAKGHMTKDAIQRYGNLKSAHPEKAVQVLLIIGNLINHGQLKDKIDDVMLKDLLKKITEPRRKTKIRRV